VTLPADMRQESVRCWCGHVFVFTFPAAQYPGYDDYWQPSTSLISIGGCERCHRPYKRYMHRGPVPPWGWVMVTAPVLRALDVVRPHAPVIVAFGFGVVVGLLLSLVAGAR
jgi:hypothetical protein